MSITFIENIFSDEDMDEILKTVSNIKFKIDANLGRGRAIPAIKNILPPKIIEKFNEIVSQMGHTSLSMSGITYVEYSSRYGMPNLPPHFDRDDNDLIINMQIESNTVWPFGLNLDVYELKNNSALIFNANKEVHWRPHKHFRSGEYVKMMFVRFQNLKNKSDYSMLKQDDPIFDDVKAFRNSYPRMGLSINKSY
jgi:hypothetical protein